MKSYSTLLIALGLVSSTVLAQSIQQAPQTSTGNAAESGNAATPAIPGQMPTPTMSSGSQESGTIENGVASWSSGASGSQAAASGRGGQLITTEIVQSRPSGEATGMALTPRTENGVTYMCGGIGADESTHMKQAAAQDYDLMMTFADKRGAYVANVDVSIKDARGRTVLETKCDGPILLVDLPTGGSYRIHADAGGRTLDRSAAVRSGKGQARQVNFVWPASTAAVAGTRVESGRTSSGGQGYDGQGNDSRSSGSGMGTSEGSAGESGR